LNKKQYKHKNNRFFGKKIGFWGIFKHILGFVVQFAEIEGNGKNDKT